MGQNTTKIHYCKPAKISGISDKIISVAAILKHSLVLDEKGNFWSWGDALESEMAIDTPEKINFPEFVKLSFLACGPTFSGALTHILELVPWQGHTKTVGASPLSHSIA
jgi:alpha-tubulin suppressor-like RCC1 family protein